jgi:glucose/arabinose dehydrogenase
VFAEGLQTIIDLYFGPDGSLYVLQHTSGNNLPPNVFGGSGLVIRIAPDGTRTTVVEGLTRPTSLLVDWDGTIYVTNNGVTAGAGEVRRIEQ